MSFDIGSILWRFLLVIPAIVIHEVSHGWAALALGDTTARDAGRLSLNPLKHIDPFGTIVLPLLMSAVFGAGFGYAKPVPINPNRFKDYRKGLFLTGIAGPTSNLVMAALAGLAFRLVTSMPAASWVVAVANACFYFCLVNLTLLFFNLIPLPPLDGSRVIPLFLSDRGMRIYHSWERYGFAILFAVLLLPSYLGLPDPLDIYFQWTVMPLLQLFSGIAL